MVSAGNSNKLIGYGDANHLASAGNSNKLMSYDGDCQLASAGDEDRLISNAVGNHLASAGDKNILVSHGNDNRLVSAGDESIISLNGYGSVGCVLGVGSKAKGVVGSWLVLPDYRKTSNGEYELKGGQWLYVDGDKIKADVLYQLVDGVLTAVGSFYDEDYYN